MHRFLAVLATASLASCMSDQSRDELEAPLVSGRDDRIEYFDAFAPALSSVMRDSVVALIPDTELAAHDGVVSVSAPSWGQLDGLCPDERFAEQPAAAFCSGVLVDWDLVLTAGHCLRVLALDDFAVVFGYWYAAPGALAIGEIRRAKEIVREALDPDGREPRLDYAWLRLDARVHSPRRPASVHVKPPALRPGDGLASIGTPGGVPLKLDRGGSVRDARAAVMDYFTADTDTSHGSSGGGAFDPDGSLLGIFARGGPDTETTDAGCNRMIHLPDGAATEEQFTYASAALQDLCAESPLASSLCRTDCSAACRALPWPEEPSGCRVATRGPGSPLGNLIDLVLLANVVLALGAFRSRPASSTVHRARRVSGR